MDDLVKRSIAIRELVRSSVYMWSVEEDQLAHNWAISIILSLPSSDAVQGEWKHTITGQPYCSNCEYVFGEDEEFSPFWKYCPMCGARMKGGAE